MHFISFYLLANLVVNSMQLNISDCGSYFQKPQYTDISVNCGTKTIGLAILICPVMYSGYNESVLLLNNNNDPACKGTVDTTVTPPVVRFEFPLNLTNSCGSVFKTISAPGTGSFADFSNIQTVNISGAVQSNDLTKGTITYNPVLKYFYSCAYPLEYLINNTHIEVSGSSIAVKDNNGSFISTLSLELFRDGNFTNPMVIPTKGLDLKTVIYVQLKAASLTSQYNVLMDRCYASVSPLPINSTIFNLFVPCSKDTETTILENGESQHARFTFPAFRFKEQSEEITTYFVHCITRLCETNSCNLFKQCSRRKRNVVPDTKAGVTEFQTLTSPAIRIEDRIASNDPLGGINHFKSTSGSLVAVSFIAFICIISIVIAAVFYMRHNHKEKTAQFA